MQEQAQECNDILQFTRSQAETKAFTDFLDTKVHDNSLDNVVDQKYDINRYATQVIPETQNNQKIDSHLLSTRIPNTDNNVMSDIDENKIEEQSVSNNERYTSISDKNSNISNDNKTSYKTNHLNDEDISSQKKTATEISQEYNNIKIFSSRSHSTNSNINSELVNDLVINLNNNENCTDLSLSIDSASVYKENSHQDDEYLKSGKLWNESSDNINNNESNNSYMIIETQETFQLIDTQNQNENTEGDNLVIPDLSDTLASRMKEHDNTTIANNETFTLPPDHPTLKPVQDALKIKIKAELERLEEILREKQADLKEYNNFREELGVVLYREKRAFKKLEDSNSKLNDKLTKLDKEIGTAREERKIATEILEKTREESKQKLAANTELKTALATIKTELRDLETLNNFEQTELKIASSTSSVEKNELLKAEARKIAQDEFISKLTQQIRTSEETCAEEESLILRLELAFKEAIEQATSLDNTNRNMNTELKTMQQNLQNWFRNRDIRASIITDLKTDIQNINIDAIDVLIKSIINDSEKEEEKIAKAKQLKEKKLAQIGTIRESIAEQKSAIIKEMEREGLLSASIKAINQQCTLGRSLELSVKGEVSFLRDKTEILKRKVRVMVNEIEKGQAVGQITSTRLKQNERGLKELAEELEFVNLELENANNELMRVSLEYDSTQSALNEAREAEKKAQIELSALEQLDSSSTAKYRQCVVNLNKNQLRLDHLNRKLSKILDSNAKTAKGTCEGPLDTPYEVALHNLKHDIEMLRAKANNLIISLQTVTKNEADDTTKVQILDMKKRESENYEQIYMGKLRRLNKRQLVLEKQNKKLLNSIKFYNEKIKHIAQRTVTIDQNITKIKSDNQCTKMEIEAVKNEQDKELEALANKVIEHENEINKSQEAILKEKEECFLWEEAIIKSKEYNNISDPSQAIKEATALQKEKNKLIELCKEQEKEKQKLVKFMEAHVACGITNRSKKSLALTTKYITKTPTISRQFGIAITAQNATLSTRRAKSTKKFQSTPLKSNISDNQNHSRQSSISNKTSVRSRISTCSLDLGIDGKEVRKI